ncbi:MAG: NAD-dependent epimerase/dehydratase family protein [Candidatus Hodarchaeales archaeon]|jgi:nucleoside-diphosphate-sugar epimerase
MATKILLTGAFGNIGESTLLALLEKKYDVRCFDIANETTRKQNSKLSQVGKFETIWGDITDKESIRPAIQGVDCVLHLAAILPPESEKWPEVTEKVNLGGTRNIIELASELVPKPKFVFSSSVSVHGPRPASVPPPVTANTPKKPTDKYTHTKVACEELIFQSELPWTILRFAAVPPLALGGDLDPMLFEMPVDQRIEFAHTRDVGQAVANSVEADTEKMVLLIGGGEKSQMLQYEFLNGLFQVMGLGQLPREAFKVPEKDDEWYYTDWMDTEESQRLLNYQNHSYEDYLIEMKKNIGFKRYIMKLISPLIRRRLLKQSPYYK